MNYTGGTVFKQVDPHATAPNFGSGMLTPAGGKMKMPPALSKRATNNRSVDPKRKHKALLGNTFQTINPGLIDTNVPFGAMKTSTNTRRHSLITDGRNAINLTTMNIAGGKK